MASTAAVLTGENTIASLRSLNLDDEFWMYEFKIVPCSKTYSHKWTLCPCAHDGETAKRRCPRLFNYKPTLCPLIKAKKFCPLGDACGYAHNVFEHWLHPSRYKTRLCSFGPNCNRPICFFAHSANELRSAAADLEESVSLEHETLSSMLWSRDQAMPGGNQVPALIGPYQQIVSAVMPQQHSNVFSVCHPVPGMHSTNMSSPHPTLQHSLRPVSYGVFPRAPVGQQAYGGRTGVRDPPVSKTHPKEPVCEPSIQPGIQNIDALMSVVNDALAKVQVSEASGSPTSTLSSSRYSSESGHSSVSNSRGNSDSGGTALNCEAGATGPVLQALVAQLQEQGLHLSKDQVAVCLSQLLAQVLSIPAS